MSKLYKQCAYCGRKLDSVSAKSRWNSCHQCIYYISDWLRAIKSTEFRLPLLIPMKDLGLPDTQFNEREYE
jgi:hypothetical protein